MHRISLPDPAGPWCQADSLALDRAVLAYEALLGVSVGRYPDPCRLLTLLYRTARSRSGDAS